MSFALYEAERWAMTSDVDTPALRLLLLVLAAQANTDAVCWPGQESLASACLTSDRTLRRNLVKLEEDGLIVRRHRYRADGRRTSDEYLLMLEPGLGWPDEPGGGRRPNSPHTPTGQSVRKALRTDRPVVSQVSAGLPDTLGADEHEGLEQTEELQGKKTPQSPPADAFPDDLPAELHESAIAAGRILKATAMARNQRREVTRAAVGHAVLTYPDRDHVRVAREVENWLIHGRGARKTCADIVGRYRRFLEGSDPMAGPALAGGAAPHSLASSPSANLRDMAATLRSQGQ